MRLEDKTVVVTGASAGLGKSMAHAMVAEGAHVVYSSFDEAQLVAAVEELPADAAGEATAVSADVRSWDDVRDLVSAAREAHGPIDVWFNNAGVQQVTAGGDRRRPLHEVPVGSWDAVIDTNLRGPFLCSKAVLPGMVERGAGRLIHTTSGAGSEGRANQSPYVASKHGLEGLAASLALELVDTGVESIVFRPPGGIYTESRSYNKPSRYEFQSAEIVAEPAVQLAAGFGENGGRYVGTADGEKVVEDTPRGTA